MGCDDVGSGGDVVPGMDASDGTVGEVSYENVDGCAVGVGSVDRTSPSAAPLLTRLSKNTTHLLEFLVHTRFTANVLATKISWQSCSTIRGSRFFCLRY